MDKPTIIWVVEDDASIRSALEIALESFGFAVTLAGDGREALESIEKQRPSLVFLDMRMPVLDGWGFAEEARARGFDPPIVVMTTREQAQKTAQDIGAVGSLGKPFALQELLTIDQQHRAP